MELYWIDGGCKQCGTCCRQIMLMHKRQEITNPQIYQQKCQEHPEYSFFKPKICGSSILYFSCNRLNHENKCSDYLSRPKFCKQFPISNFLMHDSINNSCGYKIKKTNINPPWLSPQLVELTNQVE